MCGVSKAFGKNLNLLFSGKGSLEGWIVVETDDPKALYEHAAEWAEFLDWETTPVLTDEEAGPICAKVYS